MQNKPFGLRAFNIMLKNACKEIGITKNITCNTFRKTINSERDDLGTQQHHKQHLLGHASMNVNVGNYTFPPLSKYTEKDYIRHVKLYDNNNPYKDLLL